MAAPNIVNVATITGKTAVQQVGVSNTAIVQNAAASNKVFKVNTLMIANVDGVNDATIDASIYRSDTAYRLARTINVPADSTLVLVSKDNTLYLEEGDNLELTASAASDLEAICSYEEIS